jgi:hypothetical protein
MQRLFNLRDHIKKNRQRLFIFIRDLIKNKLLSFSFLIQSFQLLLLIQENISTFHHFFHK